MSEFLFITCQIGAEKAVKGEMARLWPDFRFAFSKPGFLTFKLPPNHRLSEDFDLQAVFARSYGFSLGKVMSALPEELARKAWDACRGRTIQRIHVWENDRAPAGVRGFEPSITDAARAVHQLLLEACTGKAKACRAALPIFAILPKSAIWFSIVLFLLPTSGGSVIIASVQFPRVGPVGLCRSNCPRTPSRVRG